VAGVQVSSFDIEAYTDIEFKIPPGSASAPGKRTIHSVRGPAWWASTTHWGSILWSRNTV